ncbi:MAG: hypothetical protein K2W96_26280 [Gemmataceae bacterium]|nr:hypothetical protein [Gemmataceae bacterium]
MRRACLTLTLFFSLVLAPFAAPTAAKDPPKGYCTLWMPLSGQEHATGAKSASGELRWITNWAAQNKKGSLAKTQAVPTVPKGSYRAIFEVYYKVGKGKKLGNLRVWSGGKIIASKDVVGEDYPNHTDGGYQRAFLDFDLPPAGGTNVQLEFDYFNNHYVWLGAISMHAKGRPFYLLRHRANNAAKMEQAARDGANGIEIDIHPYGKSKDAALYEFYGYHYGDINYTVPDKFGALLAGIKKHMDSGKFVLFVMDCKQTFVDAAGLVPYGAADLAKYGKSLAAKVKKAGIPASKLMLSVPAANAGALKKAFADAGYDVALDAYVESGGSGKETDWDNIKKWSDGVVKEKATFQGVGLDEAARGPFYRYAYRLYQMIHLRDNPADHKTSIKKVYFWTVNNAKETRQLLDYGVDGILTDSVKTIKDVMKEPAYEGLFHLAGPKDRLDTVHHAGTAVAK